MKIYIKRPKNLPLLLTEISVVALFLIVLLPCVSIILPEFVSDFLRLIIILFPVLAGLMVKSTRFTIIWMIIFTSLFHLSLWVAYWQFYMGTVVGYMRTSLFFWTPLFMAYVLLALGEDYQSLFNLYIVLVSVTVLTTVIGCTMYPDASRLLAKGSAYGYQDLKNLYSRLNIGGYNFVYGLQIALPMFYYKAKMGGRFAFFYYALIGLGLYVAIVAQYTTAMLLFAVFGIFIIAIQSKSPIRTICFLAVALILFLVFRPFVASVVQNLGNIIQESGSDTIAERLFSIAKMIAGETLNNITDVDALERQRLYLVSFNTFSNFPIFGIWSHIEEFSSLADFQRIGGHSDLLDSLASVGLVGGGMFACLFCVHIRNIKKIKEDSRWLYKCSLVSVALFFILFSINTVFTQYNIGISIFLLPVLLYQRKSWNQSGLEERTSLDV